MFYVSLAIGTLAPLNYCYILLFQEMVKVVP